MRILSLLVAASIANFACGGTVRVYEPHWATSQQIGSAFVRSEFPLDGRTEAALADLATTRRDLEQRLGLTVPDAPVSISLFRTRRSYDTYIRNRIPAGVGRAALFVQDRNGGHVYAYYGRRLNVDLRHESTHAFLNAALPYVPLWLDEGLAEYFEVAPPLRYARHEHLANVKRSLWRRWRPRLVRLEALTDLADMGEAEYREAWAWAHFLLHGPEPARNALRTYLAEIAAGGFAGTLEPRLRRTFPDLEAALLRHVKTIR